VIDNEILIAAIAAEIAVLVFLLSRKAWNTLPIFCAYIAWCILDDLINFVVVYRFPGAFQKTYLIEMGPDALLQLAVLIELAWSVLRPNRSILPRGTIYVLIALVGIAGIMVWPLAGLTVPANISHRAELYVHFQQTVAILRVVCFLVMAGFSQVLSIGWKDRELQVATGLGFFSIVSLIVAVLHSRQDTGLAYHWLDRVTSASYIGTLVYWVLSFSTKEQERKEFSPQMQQLLLLMSGGARAGRIALSDLPSDHPRKRIK
jgi:hypothetical protein